MKKYFLLIIASILSSLPSLSQIKYIKLTEDSWRVMTVEEAFHPKKQTPFSLSFLSDYDMPLDTVHMFLIISYVTYNKQEVIPFNGKLLFKTGDGEIITLKNCCSLSGYIESYSGTSGEHEILSNHKTVPGTYRDSYINRGLYELSMDEIEKIVLEGIIKIRIETNSDYLDIDLPLKEQIKTDSGKIEDNRLSYYLLSNTALVMTIYNPLNNKLGLF